MIDLDILSQQRLLTRLVSEMPPDEITVLFGLQGGNEMDACPHLLAGEFARQSLSASVLFFPVVGGVEGTGFVREKGEGGIVLSFPDALDHSVPAISHDDAGDAEKGGGLEALGREVTLEKSDMLASYPTQGIVFP